MQTGAATGSPRLVFPNVQPQRGLIFAKSGCMIFSPTSAVTTPTEIALTTENGIGIH
jgi:hypothetical protein